MCLLIGAMVSMILENKTPLGPAKPPEERTAVASLSESQLVSQAIQERQLRDFKTNTLGKCNHLIKVESYDRRKFTPRPLSVPYRHRRISVHLCYGRDIELRVAPPHRLEGAALRVVQPLLDKPVGDVVDLVKRLERLTALKTDFHVYPDAEQFIQQRPHQLRIETLVQEIAATRPIIPCGSNGLKHRYCRIKWTGIAFAAGAGRAILADDMGLGKTIQGVGVAELLARQADIRRVLVVCPASLKSQWRKEIHRFCNRSVQLISGPPAQRHSQYSEPAFFTVCYCEQVLKDILPIETVPWDLIILDEGQRIKNWTSKTSRVIKGLKSRFALLLSGTPLENRLDELYSVVQFIDDRRLGCGFRFFNRHRMVEKKGKSSRLSQSRRVAKKFAPDPTAPDLGFGHIGTPRAGRRGGRRIGRRRVLIFGDTGAGRSHAATTVRDCRCDPQPLGRLCRHVL